MREIAVKDAESVICPVALGGEYGAMMCQAAGCMAWDWSYNSQGNPRTKDSLGYCTIVRQNSN